MAISGYELIGHFNVFEDRLKALPENRKASKSQNREVQAAADSLSKLKDIDFSKVDAEDASAFLVRIQKTETLFKKMTDQGAFNRYFEFAFGGSETFASIHFAFNQLKKTLLVNIDQALNVSDLIKIIARDINTTIPEAEAIINYINVNRKSLAQEAARLGKNLTYTTKDTGLARSLQFDATGEVWILLNQSNRKGDAILGKGEFKRVTQAIDFETGDVYARAVMKEQKDSAQIVEKFNEREIKCLEEFGKNTPGIVETISISRYESVSKDGKNKISKKAAIQVKYESNLSHLLKETLPHYDISARLSIAVQVAQGLMEVHKKGYIYRDLKPANILLRTLENGAKKAVITDFGTACTGPEEIDSLVGDEEEGYVAPEYLTADSLPERGKNRYSGLSNKIDIWSLGNLFEKIFPVALLSQHKELRDLIGSMKSQDPSNRPTSRQVFDRLKQLTVS